ncbi:hypothetical protein Ahy_A07g033881 isoform B [Arachis hypogaea]|uniref:Replication protein A 70 kDa DNA-binding subunit B/D first OB fold domain-containing protein n=1 Tax=Arachis hypogaea TaxID=3818 RepID=A0A445CAC4_ARAHY|nr:hypothetical protein Ahy_A07g033881 isoform B [Arachis hypogaea]
MSESSIDARKRRKLAMKRKKDETLGIRNAQPAFLSQSILSCVGSIYTNEDEAVMHDILDDVFTSFVDINDHVLFASSEMKELVMTEEELEVLCLIEVEKLLQMNGHDGIAFFSFPDSPFHVTQHLFRRPGKTTRYMKGALAIHFMLLNRSSQALRSMSLKDDIFSCCSISWVSMMAAMKSFSLPHDGDMVKIFCQNMHREYWKITIRVIRIWSLCDPREETDEPAFLHIVVMDKSVSCYICFETFFNPRLNKIQCTLKKEAINQFREILKEGELYSISRFMIVSNIGAAKVVKHRYKLLFRFDTEFPEASYSLETIESVVQMGQDLVYLFGIIMIYYLKCTLITNKMDMYVINHCCVLISFCLM